MEVASGALDPTVLADKALLLEGPMEGIPVARTATRSGEWVYTAYRGRHAFVHALDTVRRTAVCIDLPHRASRARDWKLRLDGAGAVSWVTSPSTRTAARISTRSFKVRTT